MIRYRSFPFELTGSDYLKDLELGLVKTSVNIFKITDYRNIDVVHFHFPEALWRSKYNIISFLKFLYFLFFFLFIKKIFKTKFIFTLHNKIAHFQVNKFNLEIFYRRCFFSFCNKIVVMNEFLKEELILEFNVKSDKIVKIPHGKYEFDKPENHIVNPFEYLLNEKYVIIFDDKSRANKLNNVYLNSVLKNINSEVKIIIIEKPKNIDDINYSLELLYDNLYVIRSYIKTYEFNFLISTSLACLLLYDSITTSGLYYYIKSLNQKVIATRLPFFIENCCSCDYIVPNMDFSQISIYLNNEKKYCTCYDTFPLVYDTSQQYNEVFKFCLNKHTKV